MEVLKFQALVFDKLNEEDLYSGISLGSTPLLLKLLKLPLSNPSQVAVLSWRWDGDLATRGSKNIARVIQSAKRLNIQYLFLDIISIDQTLSREALIQQVVSFSSLYKTILVIAVYRGQGAFIHVNIYRPWILHEIQLCRYNPTRIIP
ncbi:uncharacterized protein PODANS_5_6610 [Podospora anserina S mat+]|uniref:Podospora anserina S mat+ genomic DNA chromosome 5, supercontig 8 n=1 Tax=Podospora anserina (strain S / ATCC MYA-4624 / DSM 980 / FGSC 10383) TaxID=515849 RepID=B2AM85_PODAN|nr:uncharacterized protein PODANS_5_6610 [Podospora anserina S mat+]CAP65073.1 unnamed protein product [Podospora anserina S mat+]CDP29835.1 Putative protein of unknown function [Podospora anserina S mat+]